MRAVRRIREAHRRGEAVNRLDGGPLMIEQVRPRPFWLRRPVLVAASLLVAVGMAILAVVLIKQRPASTVVEQPRPVVPAPEMAGSAPSPWDGLEIPKAASTPPGEGPLLRNTQSPTAFGRAMATYQQNKFATAAEQREVVSQLEPERAEAHFYRGVSLLPAGQPQDAIAPLKEAGRLSDGPDRRAVGTIWRRRI